LTERDPSPWDGHNKAYSNRVHRGGKHPLEEPREPSVLLFVGLEYDLDCARPTREIQANAIRGEALRF
jgi:hypothetical protein